MTASTTRTVDDVVLHHATGVEGDGDAESLDTIGAADAPEVPGSPEVADSPDGVVAGTAGGEVSITLCPDGPLLLRGPATLLGADGQPLPRPRNVVALCRCGGSAIKPLCDGTHKVNGFRSEDG
jgi:hypothetical protein